MAQLSTGDTAPDFDLRDDTGTPVALGDLRGRKVALYFYPKAFTPGCTVESCDFRDNHDALLAAGYEVLGVSPDPVERLAEFRAEYELPFRLLSDEDHAVADAYGAWGKKSNYGREYEGIIRSTVVIDEEGRVERAWYNVKAQGHVGRVMESLVS